MALAELRGVRVEYGPLVVPLARPFLLGVKLEYTAFAMPSGLVQNGVVDQLITLSISADTPLLSRIDPAELLAYTQVSSNTDFDAEAKWRYLVLQFMHRDSGQLRNVYQRKVGAFWEGYLVLEAGSPTGYWDHRSTMLKALTGSELILLPTRFLDGQSLVVRA